jgi:putative membrane protein
MWRCNFSSFGFGGHGGYGMAGIFGGGMLWTVVLVLAIGLLLWSFTRNKNQCNGSAADKADSLEILKARLARGEIGIEEYKTLKDVLRP